MSELVARLAEGITNKNFSILDTIIGDNYECNYLGFKHLHYYNKLDSFLVVKTKEGITNFINDYFNNQNDFKNNTKNSFKIVEDGSSLNLNDFVLFDGFGDTDDLVPSTLEHKIYFGLRDTFTGITCDKIRGFPLVGTVIESSEGVLSSCDSISKDFLTHSITISKEETPNSNNRLSILIFPLMTYLVSNNLITNDYLDSYGFKYMGNTHSDLVFSIPVNLLKKIEGFYINDKLIKIKAEKKEYVITNKFD